MGVTDLWTVLSPVARKVQLKDLEGQTVAVDLSGWIVESEQSSAQHHIRKAYIRIGTLIETDQICSDGYGVENLIGTSLTQRQQGFMAEYFIKPPVNVLITFPVPTELGWIRLGLVRGPVKLTGLELWVSHSPQGGEADDFELLARKYDCAEDVVWFRNRRYVPRGPFAELNEPLDKRDARSASAQTLKSFHCKFVCRLKLRLVRVQGSTSVGLGSCQVWGQPMGNSCDVAFQKALLRKSMTVPHASQRSRVTAAVESKPSTSRDVSTGNSPQISLDLEIPSDFQDALTYELMTQPVLLPGGQVIDQSTLDKHVESEHKWGRPPSDPFTGVTFSEDARPTSLTELKTRIDHFVVRNLDRLGNIPRTLGRGCSETGSTTTSCSSRCTKVKSGGTLLSGPRPKKCDEEARQKVSKRKLDSSLADVLSEQVAPPLTTCPNNEVDQGTHEERLARSLSDSLAETLGQIRKRSNVAPSQKVDTLCCACGKSDATHSVPCGHRYCRTCLLDYVDKGRCFCGRTFLSSQVSRVHSISGLS